MTITVIDLPPTAVRPSLADAYELLDRAHNALLAAEARNTREHRAQLRALGETQDAKHALIVAGVDVGRRAKTGGRS